MNAQEQLNYQEGINNFANAHAATVATVTGLQQQNATLQELPPAMQQQINVMCMQAVVIDITCMVAVGLYTRHGRLRACARVSPPPNSMGGAQMR